MRACQSSLSVPTSGSPFMDRTRSPSASRPQKCAGVLPSIRVITASPLFSTASCAQITAPSHWCEHKGVQGFGLTSQPTVQE